MLEGDPAGRGRNAMRSVKAVAFLFAAACLFNSAIGRPSIQHLNIRPSLIHGRFLLAEKSSFDVTVTSNGQSGSTSSITPLFTVNFGRALVQKNPLGLFTIDGADRVDVVYSKDTGMLWVLSFVEIKDQPGKVSLYVENGVATAADGGAVNNYASISLDYIPSPTAVAAANGTENSSTFATAASWGVAGSLAVSLGAAVLSPTGAVGVGAINFAGFAQTFAMSGTLPITNMPSNYKAAASGMEWVALQPKVGPANTAPTEEEKKQAAELADTTARFPYTPVEVKILPDGSYDPSTNIGADGQTGEVVSVPVLNNSTDPDVVSNDSDASENGEDTSDIDTDTESAPMTVPVLVVIVQLPEQDLISSNGTKPSPFIVKPASSAAAAAEPFDQGEAEEVIETEAGNEAEELIEAEVTGAEEEEEEEKAADEGTEEEEESTNIVTTDDDAVITVPTSAPVVQEQQQPQQQQEPQQQQPATSGATVAVESTPPTPTGGIVLGATPPVPVVQQGGEDNGIILETPQPPSPNDGTEEDTVVVILPEDNTTEKSLSPPPGSSKNKPPPPAVVPTNTSTGGNDGNSSNNGAVSPSPAPGGNADISLTPDKAPSSVGEAGKDAKGLGGSPPPPPPPRPLNISSDRNGTAQQEATEDSGIIIDIPGAKLPSPPLSNPPSSAPAPSPLPSSPKSLTPALAPSPLPSSKAPAPAPSPEKSPSPFPSPSPPIRVSPPPLAPAPTPSVAPVIAAKEGDSDDCEDDIVDQDGPKVNPAPNNGPPVARKSRMLLLNDPLTALSSSGFSYVVVTATADGSGGATVNSTSGASAAAGETIGASTLSRIRTIQNAGEGPDADARRLSSLWDVLFWTAVAIGATLVLHLCVLGLLRWAKKSVPKMLHLPRMELLVFMMTLPMIAAAGAGLLKSTNGGIVTLGVVFAVVIPFGFLSLASVFIVKYLLRSAVEQRRALYVLVATQDAHSELDAQLASSLGSTPEGSLTAAMLGPEARDSLAEFGGASGSGASTSHAAAAAGGSSNNGAPPTTEQTTTPSFFKKATFSIYIWTLRPVFGFQDSSAHAEALAITDGAAWLGRGKWDAEFVKRYGCFFEDAHGPQVLRVRSRYDPTAISSSFNSMGTEDVVGTGVLVPATSTGAAEGALQALQTFGIIFAVTKMVLFAVIINGPGGVNNIGQVMALLVVALMHVVYLRLCHPYRLRIELAAEMVASTCDLAIFACGIALIAKPQWSPSERHTMGVAMLALQAVGFLIFISVRVGLAFRTLGKTVGPAVKDLWPKKLLFGSRTGGVVNRNSNTTSASDAQFLSS
ncbi:hypothetical protein Ndes2526B_g08074 [Nannochloris sp. 'desiccata']|nr:hypothetical protein KSW81_002713 [Chlorella desiccata (nom. nud.)]